MEKKTAAGDVEEPGKAVEKKAKFKETCNPNESVPSLGRVKGAE